MNIMFCGDSHAEDGILITTLSLLKNTSAPLHLYILTMQAEGYEAFSEQAFNLIKKIIKEKVPNNTAELIDCTELFKKSLLVLTWRLVSLLTPCLGYLRIKFRKFLTASCT